MTNKEYRDRYRKGTSRKKYLLHKKEQRKRYKKKYPEKIRVSATKHRMNRKVKVLSFYSGSKPFCKCCGEKEIKFLSIDHINGGGKKHRKVEKIGDICEWLVRNKFPDGFQVLCFNCNCAKGFWGECPHIINKPLKR